jgi:arylsulfatase A-like enzyme
MKKLRTNRARIHQKLESLNAVEDAIHGYLACMSYADSMIGRVLDALETSPYADNTIVVLWSDHGYHHGEKSNWGKHTLWERTSNVPFIWAGPGVAKGKRTEVTVSLIDIYPTLADLCQLPQPRQQLEGTSIADILANPVNAKDRTVFLPHTQPGEFAAINCDWRYIRYSDGEELYDLKKDPNEWHNLADRPALAAVKARLASIAPKKFAPQAQKFNVKRDLMVKDGKFEWKYRQGNTNPNPTYKPPVTSKPPFRKTK